MKAIRNNSELLSFASVMSGAPLKGVPQPKPWSDNNSATTSTTGPQPTYGYMRQKELMKLVPFSPATLWRLVKSGKFVRPVKLSERITAWSRLEVQQWLNAQGSQK